MDASNGSTSNQQNEEAAPVTADQDGGMVVDQENKSQSAGVSHYSLPNFGTKIFLKSYPAKVDSPKSVPELFEEYKKYSLLHKKDQMMNAIEAGTASYMISS